MRYDPSAAAIGFLAKVAREFNLESSHEINDRPSAFNKANRPTMRPQRVCVSVVAVVVVVATVAAAVVVVVGSTSMPNLVHRSSPLSQIMLT